MTKTIEDAAKRFADRECKIGQVDWDALYKGYYHGMKDLFSLHLASRMTEEEKEKINRLYVDVNDKLQTCLNAKSYNQISELDNEYKKGLNMGMIIALKHIFSMEFYK